MGVRRFDRSAQRFLQLDQFQGALDDLALASDPLTQNRYSLAASNPLSAIEWDGHVATAVGGGGPNPRSGSGGSEICYYCYPNPSGGTTGANISYRWVPPSEPFAKPRRPRTVTHPYSPPQCAHLAVECGGTITIYNNPDDDWTLFLAWLLGYGQHQKFNQYDPLTQYLMKDENQEETRAMIRADLRRGGPYTDIHNYNDPKTRSAFIKDMKGFFTQGTDPSGSNYADSYLGSYAERWWAIPRNGNTATAYFQVTNKTDLNSFFHPEITTSGTIKSVNEYQPEFAFVASFGGINMSAFMPQYQVFQWQEIIHY
jgi:hypothetical protein